MDAVGCFEGDEEEEEDDEEEEEIEVEEEVHKQVLGERGCGKEAGGWTPRPGETSPHLPGARRRCAGICKPKDMPQAIIIRNYLQYDNV